MFLHIGTLFFIRRSFGHMEKYSESEFMEKAARRMCNNTCVPAVLYKRKNSSYIMEHTIYAGQDVYFIWWAEHKTDVTVAIYVQWST